MCELAERLLHRWWEQSPGVAGEARATLLQEARALLRLPGHGADVALDEGPHGLAELEDRLELVVFDVVEGNEEQVAAVQRRHVEQHSMALPQQAATDGCEVGALALPETRERADEGVQRLGAQHELDGSLAALPAGLEVEREANELADHADVVVVLEEAEASGAEGEASPGVQERRVRAFELAQSALEPVASVLHLTGLAGQARHERAADGADVRRGRRVAVVDGPAQGFASRVEVSAQEGVFTQREVRAADLVGLERGLESLLEGSLAEGEVGLVLTCEHVVCESCADQEDPAIGAARRVDPRVVQHLLDARHEPSILLSAEPQVRLEQVGVTDRVGRGGQDLARALVPECGEVDEPVGEIEPGPLPVCEAPVERGIGRGLDPRHERVETIHGPVPALALAQDLDEHELQVEQVGVGGALLPECGEARFEGLDQSLQLTTRAQQTGVAPELRGLATGLCGLCGQECGPVGLDGNDVARADADQALGRLEELGRELGLQLAVQGERAELLVDSKGELVLRLGSGGRRQAQEDERRGKEEQARVRG